MVFGDGGQELFCEEDSWRLRRGNQQDCVSTNVDTCPATDAEEAARELHDFEHKCRNNSKS